MHGEMVALETKRSPGTTLRSWVLHARDGDERMANRIANTNRWRYGSYRPSYRAVLVVDGREGYPPNAADIAAD